MCVRVLINANAGHALNAAPQQMTQQQMSRRTYLMMMSSSSTNQCRHLLRHHMLERLQDRSRAAPPQGCPASQHCVTSSPAASVWISVSGRVQRHVVRCVWMSRHRGFGPCTVLGGRVDAMLFEAVPNSMSSFNGSSCTSIQGCNTVQFQPYPCCKTSVCLAGGSAALLCT